MYPTPEEIERALAGIFARPEFSPREPSLWARLLGRLGEWLRELLPDPTLTGTGARVVWWVMVAVVVVVAVLLGSWLARGVLRWSRRRKRVAARSEVFEPVAGAARVMAVEWEAAATLAAAAGRWRDAILALYQVLLLRLEAAGAVRYDPAKTPGDYRREVAREGDVHGSLHAFLTLYEPIAFGRYPADAAAFGALWETTRQVGRDG